MTDLVRDIRDALRSHADPQRAPGQQAYMKSAMPFLGISVPVVRRLARATAKAAHVVEGDPLRDAARALWDRADYREERYAAMTLLAIRAASSDGAVVPLIEHMVRTGRWWDYTDELAHRLAQLHDRDPVATAALVRRWCTDDDMWIRRIAIISQLGRRDRVDRGLLVEAIEPNLADGEFFIRKAIGWALREYARVDPQWVREYADSHPLSPLSRREALKHL
ncbi:MAG: DNA alkylation repair protein [Microbacterium sp.]